MCYKDSDKPALKPASAIMTVDYLYNVLEGSVRKIYHEMTENGFVVTPVSDIFIVDNIEQLTDPNRIAPSRTNSLEYIINEIGNGVIFSTENPITISWE